MAYGNRSGCERMSAEEHHGWVASRRGRTPLPCGQWRSNIAGGGFEPPTFGLCDLTHLSVRVGLYLHPHGVPAIQSLRLPPTSRAWFGIALSPVRRRFHRL